VPGPTLRMGDRLLEVDGTLVMGVVNASPDSFSDAGRYQSLEDRLHLEALPELRCARVSERRQLCVARAELCFQIVDLNLKSIPATGFWRRSVRQRLACPTASPWCVQQ